MERLARTHEQLNASAVRSFTASSHSHFRLRSHRNSSRTWLEDNHIVSRGLQVSIQCRLLGRKT